MIAVRRARHLAIWLFLAVVLPILVVLAVWARVDRPTNDALPKAIDSFADDTRPSGGDSGR